MKTLSNSKKKNAQIVRMKKAERDFLRLEKEIRPFIRKRRLREETSAGRWMESSSIEFLDV